MRKLLTIICCTLGVLSAQAQQKWAVVVGISDYAEESGWSKLSGTNDIELIVPVLHRVGISEQNITTLSDAQATKQNIRNALLSLTERASEGDMIYFHFSGHGQQITDINGDEKLLDALDFWDESIVPYDARIDNAGGYDGENHIVDDELNNILSQLKDCIGERGSILVVLDACHSGGGTRGEADEEVEEELFVRGTANRFDILHPENKEQFEPVDVRWVCISACREHEQNFEYKMQDGTRYGRLSYALSSVLATKMNISELEQRIRQLYNMMPLPGKRYRQTPNVDYNLRLKDKPIF